MLSAIIIVEQEARGQEKVGVPAAPVTAGVPLAEKHWRGTPLVCADVLGRSVAVRFMDEMRRAGIDMISLVGDVCDIPASTIDPGVSLMPCSTEVAWRTARQDLITGQQSGIEAMLIIRAGAYVDLDLKDTLQAHNDQGQATTRVFDKQGPLNMWIVDPARFSGSQDLLIDLQEDPSARYFVTGYVNRLEHPRDLRQLVVDGLTSRCRLRPQGTEIRSRVWIGHDAQIHKDARVVAPAFIGSGTRIAEQCLITRCSNIERDCRVDFGTVVEDSSILSNSYLGIGLDLSHAIAEGSHLFNLQHDVTLEIADPCIIRQNTELHQEASFPSPAGFVFGDGQFAQAEEGRR